MEQIFRRKEIVLVPYPFSDFSQTKVRPTLVISNDKFNSKSKDVIVCAITSTYSDEENTVPILEADWKDGHYSPSFIKFSSVMTIDKRIIKQRIGRLATPKFNEVIENLGKIVRKVESS